MKYKKTAAVILAAMMVTASFSLASCGGDDAKETVVDTADTTETTETEEQEVIILPDAVRVEDVTEGGRVVGQRGYNGDVLVYESSLDAKGRVTERTNYLSDGKTAESYVFWYVGDDEEPNEYDATEYVYDGDELSSKKVARYDKNMLPISVYVYGGDGSLSEAGLYEYNDAGLIVKSTLINSKNVVTLITEYEYDDNGREILATYKNGKNEVTSYIESEYNGDGNILRETKHEPDGTVTGYAEYIYDENGEFAERAEYVLEDGEFVRYE